MDIIVCGKREGILRPCQPVKQPDGFAWLCPVCRFVCVRMSYGFLNGIAICPCGAEIEVTVGGQVVDLEQHYLDAPPEQPTKEFTDAEFLKECGIATD